MEHRSHRYLPARLRRGVFGVFTMDVRIAIQMFESERMVIIKGYEIAIEKSAVSTNVCSSEGSPLD